MNQQSMYDRIENDFRYHAPKEENIVKFSNIRETAKAFAHLIDENVPNGREKSTALTKLEETVMWANAGVAHNQD